MTEEYVVLTVSRCPRCGWELSRHVVEMRLGDVVLFDERDVGALDEQGDVQVADDERREPC